METLKYDKNIDLNGEHILKPEELTEGLRGKTEAWFKGRLIKVWDITTEQYVTGIFEGFNRNSCVSNMGIKKVVEMLYKSSHYKYRGIFFDIETGKYYDINIKDIIRGYYLHNKFYNKNIPKIVVIDTSSPLN